MTKLLLFIKHHCGWIWQIVENINGLLFGLRYPKFKAAAERVLQQQSELPNLQWSLVTEADLPQLASWLQQQVAEQHTHFRPHGFTFSALNRLWKNPAFLLIKVCSKEEPQRIIGYHFLRCFCIGRAFHGLIVDPTYSKQGIGGQMWRIVYWIARENQLNLLATISDQNIPSLKSAEKAVRLKE